MTLSNLFDLSSLIYKIKIIIVLRIVVVKIKLDNPCKEFTIWRLAHSKGSTNIWWWWWWWWYYYLCQRLPLPGLIPPDHSPNWASPTPPTLPCIMCPSALGHPSGLPKTASLYLHPALFFTNLSVLDRVGGDEIQR